MHTTIKTGGNGDPDREKYERLRASEANRLLFEIARYCCMPAELIGDWLKVHSGDCDCEYCQSGILVEELADALQALEWTMTQVVGVITSLSPGSPPEEMTAKDSADKCILAPFTLDDGRLRNAL